MLTLPNILSLTRIPLAFLFLQDNALYRCLAIALALLSDILDGYLARKYHLSSQLGAVIDPITDKFFVVFVLAVLIKENQLTLLDAAAMISRDFAVFLFGSYLVLTRRLSKYQFKAIWSGKVTTFLQLTVLIGMTCHIAVPAYLFIVFVFLGIAALAELFLFEKKVFVIAHSRKKAVFHDLDYRAGTWSNNDKKVFDDNVKSFDHID